MSDDNNVQPDANNQNDPAGSGDNEIEVLRNQIETLTSSWKRAVADYQNLEKRVSKEREEYIRFSSLLIISRLVGLLDNLEMVKTHVEDKGLDIVFKELKTIVLEQGVGEIGLKVGDQFDPHLAECVEVVAGDSDDKITEVLAKGYIMGDRVVRPAKVKVAKMDLIQNS